MQHPVITQANAKVRYDQFIQDANHHRQLKCLQVKNPGFVAQLVAIVSGLFQSYKRETVRTKTSKTTA